MSTWRKVEGATITESDVTHIGNLMALASIDKSVRLKFDATTGKVSVAENKGQLGPYKAGEIETIASAGIYEILRQSNKEFATKNPKFEVALVDHLSHEYAGVIASFVDAVKQTADDKNKAEQEKSTYNFFIQLGLASKQLTAFENNEAIKKQRATALHIFEEINPVVQGHDTYDADTDTDKIVGALGIIENYIGHLVNRREDIVSKKLLLPTWADNVPATPEARLESLKEEVGAFAEKASEIRQFLEDNGVQIADDVDEETSSDSSSKTGGHSVENETE